MGSSESKSVLSKEDYKRIFNQFKAGLITTAFDLSDEDIETYRELFDKLKLYESDR